MQIPVLLEKVKGNGYRARGTEPFAISARGSTREQALAKLRTKIQARLKKGTEVVALELDPQPDPGWNSRACSRVIPGLMIGNGPSKNIVKRSTTTRRRCEPVRARHGHFTAYQDQNPKVVSRVRAVPPSDRAISV